MNEQTKKEKGNQFELHIARRLREIGLDSDAKRMKMSGAMEDFKADVITNLPVSFECKRHAKLSKQIMGFYYQATAGAKKKEMPVVVAKEDNGIAMAILSFEDLLQLMVYAKDGGWLQELAYSKSRQTRREK